ncbi:hypothetical protein [Dongia rigui]|uniref:Uncharacterized protein n=1 Tax=Dongia rigui TaxID=940149 RepID=A0ABU5E1C9_9PROT|nr:hypothetical protein [Dongia rigui]MDY0873112.1 hypothetical protein [Dongia rigui]
MAQKPNRSARISPPAALDVDGKMQFRRICRQRTALNRPVMPAEIDDVVSLILARKRLSQLQALFDRAAAEAARSHCCGSTAKSFIATASAVDRTTALVGKLARALGLASDGRGRK